MNDAFRRWLAFLSTNADIGKLAGVSLFIVAALWLFIAELAPFLTGILIAYLLEGPTRSITRRWPRIGRTAATTLVVLATILLTLVALYFLPKFLLQLRALGDNLPQAATIVEGIVNRINDYLPEDLALEKGAAFDTIGEKAAVTVGYLFDNTLGLAGDLFSLFLYMVLMPLLVFFLLKDKEMIIAYLKRFVPPTPALRRLWQSLNREFGSYVRGKFLEATIIGALSWIVFLLFKMNYAFALATLIGLSVFVPFVGAVAVTFPVLMFAYLQFGWSADFAWIVGLYTAIQAFDGQILVPLLFSEAVKIHPVSLFAAIIFFGNLWGIWGVFFAIPLAAVIKNIINFVAEQYAAADTG